MRITTIDNPVSLKIGIVGGGFAGTAIAAVLHKLSQRPIEIIICEKSGHFGAGPAYSTPFFHHLLNVRAQDMSAFQDDPTHFTNWLSHHADKDKYFDSHIPLGEQFAPRQLYHQYLQSLLETLQAGQSKKFKLILEPVEVVDIDLLSDGGMLIFQDGRKAQIDKVILALGNNPPTVFPFPVSADIQCINNPWDYTAVANIASSDPVLIVGTGLSMIDAVLTLYHQRHQGMIYAVSRHGLLPLPHADIKPGYPLTTSSLSSDIRHLTTSLRAICQSHVEEGGDWRSVVNTLRLHIPKIWEKASVKDKKRFLRHVLPYWNIHRHRVHTVIMDLLSALSAQRQLKIMSGYVVRAKQGLAKIKLRHSQEITDIPVKWLINCMGPVQQLKATSQPLLGAILKRKVATIDTLQLGLSVNSLGALKDDSGHPSTILYALGAPTKGTLWEINAVPDIRSQIFDLARHLLAMR
jgi:uncharacterized NAD(P)/FAD-binding protein YdhS